jgi:hypothetical protein
MEANASPNEDSLEKLGREGHDIVTGFKGTVTAVCFYWGSATRLAITPKVDNQGKIVKEEWFDEPRVELKD